MAYDSPPPTAAERYAAWVETTKRIILRHFVATDEDIARRIAATANDR